VRLSNVALRIEGEARSASDYDEVRKALTSSLPTGLKLAADKVRPPMTDPFIFSASLGPTSLTLSGSVPSEMTRKRLKELSRQLFARPTLDDQLQLASGAPTDWDEAVDAALRALGRLDSGKVALSGIALTIEGIAPDEGTAVAVSYQLKRDLPPVFSTSEAITWKQADAAPGEGDDIVSRIKAIVHTGSLPKAEADARP
jgi:OOP family OmpA-OmpF porin